MLRNALAHGVEMPAVRLARGKPAQGLIQLRLASQGGYVLVSLVDDGAGIDVAAVRRKARQQGVLDDQAASDDQAALQLIFRSGLSTAGEVSQVAGRGVGMDVVAEALRQVGGDVQVETMVGRGTTFRMHVPLTQAITQGITVSAGEQLFAMPYSGIEAIIRASRAELVERFGSDEPVFDYGGESYPLVELATLLGLPSHLGQGPEGMLSLLVMHLGGRRMVLAIDALHGSRQLYIKALGPFVARIPAVAGATLTGDGRVMLVLDAAELFRLSSLARARREKMEMAPVQAAPARPLVLVVDDSITIRKVTARILERHGIDVATSKDGVDALAWLHDHVPTAVISDIEMPRMDGFELLSVIRNEQRTTHLPVIMITSRTGTKHREKAEALGVNAYLGKPYTEAELINTLSMWLPAGAVVEAREAGGAA